MAVSWKGVFPAITTKFTSQNQLDLGLFKKNLSAQLDAGINGIVLGGSLGEASVLTNDEKEILVKETLAFVNGKVPVIISSNVSASEYTSLCSVGCCPVAISGAA